MFITRTLTRRTLFGWLAKFVLMLTVIHGTIAILYAQGYLKIVLPWLPVSVIGTAVAFFVTFKNNQAYDRMWEARKIWGGIVNDSRTWGMMVDSYIRSDMGMPKNEVLKWKQKLIYRHLAWIYTHRIQLLEPMEWEQLGDKGFVGRTARRYQKYFGIGQITDEVKKADIKKYLPENELAEMNEYKNMATQLINYQSRDLILLHDKEYITQFQHKEMVKVLQNFYTLQGQNERIKKFPFPRDYSGMSKAFVYTFVTIFPFSLIPELMSISHQFYMISIPISVLIGLFYIIMEDLGDFHENPFMGTPHAIPMLSMCRTIEIDMLEMIGEKDLPQPVKAKNGVLM
jgi:putative membrane protein